MSSTPLSFFEVAFLTASPSRNSWPGPKLLAATSSSKPYPSSILAEAKNGTTREDRRASYSRIRKKGINHSSVHTLASSTRKTPKSEDFNCSSGPNIEIEKKVGTNNKDPISPSAELPSAYARKFVRDRHGDEGIKNVPEITTINPHIIHTTARFGRLRMQRVRDRVPKTSQTKRESSQDEDPLVAENASMHRSFSTNSDSMKYHKTRAQASREVPVSGGSALTRGWGNGGPRDTFVSESPGLRGRKPSDSHFFSRKSFKDLGCSEYVIESLKRQLFLRPSHIQAMAFAHVIEGNSCIIADQSGSGKTLAYLAPIIQRLREELQGGPKSSTSSPRAIVIVPTAELASQVLSNCRMMSKYGVPVRSMVVTGGFRRRTQLENLQEGVDILIVTPGRLILLIEEGFLQLTSLRCAVFDEVDVLFNDEGFEIALQRLIDSSPVSTQYLLVTATLPVDKYNKLIELFPDCKVVMGPGIHRISHGLEEVLVDCSGNSDAEKTPDTAFLNKKSALLQLVEKSPVSKTIVFCNKIETCRRVENVLRRFDKSGTHVQALPFHAALAQETRLANMAEFTGSRPARVSQFLVCTDRASRGIDFANVDHVVLFDFPRDPSEYVRRVGRTARGAGGKGKAFIFVVGKQVSLARRIIGRNEKGHPVHDVPSAYELAN